MNNKLTLFLAFAIAGLHVAAQTTTVIFREDFSTLPAGLGFPGALTDPLMVGQGFATLGTAGLHPNFGRFSVNGTADRLESYSIQGGEVSWTSKPIDIACYSNIQIRTEMSGNSALNAVQNGSDKVDYIAVDFTIIYDDLTTETFQDLIAVEGPFASSIFISEPAFLNACVGDSYSGMSVTVRFFSDKLFEGHTLSFVEVIGERPTPDNVSFAVNCDGPQPVLTLATTNGCTPEYSITPVNTASTITNQSGIFTVQFNTGYEVSIGDLYTGCSTTFDLFVSDCDVVLPIELLRFTGAPDEYGIRLQWETATELNNDYMAVERSSDGIVFRELGRVRGAGTTNVTQRYDFLDRQPQPGDNYYRLRQVDFDGTANYHQVIAVAWQPRAEPAGDLRLFPNIAHNNIRIEWSSRSKAAAPYSIYSSTGQLVRTGSAPAGRNACDLSVGDLPAGTYLFSLILDGRRLTTRFIRQ